MVVSDNEEMLTSLSLLSLLTLHREGKLADIEPSLLESIVCRVLDSVADVTSLPRSLRKLVLATKTPQARRLAARLIEEWVIDRSLEPPPSFLVGKGWREPHRRLLPRRGTLGGKPLKPLKHGFQVNLQGPTSTDYKLTFYWFGKKHGLGHYDEDLDPASEIWYKHGVRDGLAVWSWTQQGDMEVVTYANGEIVDRQKYYDAQGEAELDEVVDNYRTGEWLRDAITDVAYDVLEA